MATYGGARNRSGPQPDPNSGRSERRKLTFRRLPREGYQGAIPEFPLAALRGGSKDVYDREAEVWAALWRTPQAAAWAEEPWRWEVLAEFCRFKTIAEREPNVSVGLIANLTRYRDQLGLTPAGLRDNGWQIAVDELAEKRDEKETRPASSRDRLKRVK